MTLLVFQQFFLKDARSVVVSHYPKIYVTKKMNFIGA